MSQASEKNPGCRAGAGQAGKEMLHFAGAWSSLSHERSGRTRRQIGVDFYLQLTDRSVSSGADGRQAIAEIAPANQRLLDE